MPVAEDDPPLAAASYMTSGRQLARSTAWNLVALTLPLLLAVLCIPLLIEQAGVERFGIWAIGLALVGYCRMFDFGLGRALTKLVAERSSRPEEIGPMVATGLLLIACFGVLGAVLLWLVSELLVYRVLEVPVALTAEALAAFGIIALVVPVVTLTVGLRGILEAYQRFRTIAFVNVVMGLLTFGGAVLALRIQVSVTAMIAALALSRICGLSAYALAAWKQIRSAGPIHFRAPIVYRLLRFGSWMTVTNIVGPMMDYMDRFIIGALLSMAAVAYYATPYDVVSRLGGIAGALGAVLFPAMASALLRDPQRAAWLCVAGVRYVLLLVSGPVLLTVLFAREGLTLWLGSELASQSELVLQLLAIGFLVNAAARMPYALLHAAGRPDLTAKLHLIELPVYVAVLVALVTHWGVAGAAATWSLRATVDAGLLFWFSRERFRLVSCQLHRVDSLAKTLLWRVPVKPGLCCL